MKNLHHYIKIAGEKIPVTEKIYRVYKRSLWAENKRLEREKRCHNVNGSLCTNDCRSCDKSQTGIILSLDRFMEEGFDIPDTVDAAEFVANKLLLEQLVAALDDLDPEERSLIDALFLNNRTGRDYAIEIGISHQAVEKRRKKVVRKLRHTMGMD